jgi:hypothetical protein
MEKWWDFAAAGLALVAAACWFASAYRELPVMATYWGHTPDNDPFFQAVKFSARWNRYAAGFSGASALCMGVGSFIRWKNAGRH